MHSIPPVATLITTFGRQLPTLLIGRLAYTCLFAGLVVSQAMGDEAPERRLKALALGQESRAVPPLLQGLQSDPNALVRRAAVRSLGEIGEPARQHLIYSMDNDPDALTRRTAFRALVRITKAENLQPLFQKAIKDNHDLVRLAVVKEAAALDPRPAWVAHLLTTAQKDATAQISRDATKALWTFNDEVISARERTEFQDKQLITLSQINLQKTGWKFRTDPSGRGHIQEWYEAKADETDWLDIEIEQPWQNFGHSYEGIAWYRHTFALPTQPPLSAVDLVFEAVDTNAWIWINGKFAGTHNMGPAGWNKRFAIDARALLNWGDQNQITVRVEKPTGQHGGIWKPVYLELLK